MARLPMWMALVGLSALVLPTHAQNTVILGAPEQDAEAEEASQCYTYTTTFIQNYGSASTGPASPSTGLPPGESYGPGGVTLGPGGVTIGPGGITLGRPSPSATGADADAAPLETVVPLVAGSPFVISLVGLLADPSDFLVSITEAPEVDWVTLDTTLKVLDGIVPPTYPPGVVVVTVEAVHATGTGSPARRRAVGDVYFFKVQIVISGPASSASASITGPAVSGSVSGSATPSTGPATSVPTGSNGSPLPPVSTNSNGSPIPPGPTGSNGSPLPPASTNSDGSPIPPGPTDSNGSPLPTPSATGAATTFASATSSGSASGTASATAVPTIVAGKPVNLSLYSYLHSPQDSILNLTTNPFVDWITLDKEAKAAVGSVPADQPDGTIDVTLTVTNFATGLPYSQTFTIVVESAATASSVASSTPTSTSRVAPPESTSSGGGGNPGSPPTTPSGPPDNTSSGGNGGPTSSGTGPAGGNPGPTSTSSSAGPDGGNPGPSSSSSSSSSSGSGPSNVAPPSSTTTIPGSLSTSSSSSATTIPPGSLSTSTSSSATTIPGSLSTSSSSSVTTSANTCTGSCAFTNSNTPASSSSLASPTTSTPAGPSTTTSPVGGSSSTTTVSVPSPGPSTSSTTSTQSTVSTTSSVSSITASPASSSTSSSTSQSTTSTTTSAAVPTYTVSSLQKFTCDKYAYDLVQFNLFRVDSTTGASTQVNTNNVNANGINAIGYNVLDDYIYGIAGSGSRGGALVRVSAQGTSETVVQPIPPTFVNGVFVPYSAGDVDNNGYYWATTTGTTAANGAPGRWFQLDLVPGSATYAQVVASGAAAHANIVSDWAYVPAQNDSLLYGLGQYSNAGTYQTYLMTFDRGAAKAWTQGASYGSAPGNHASTAGIAQWGAVWTTPDGLLYGIENNSGEIWSFMLAAPFTAAYVATGPTSVGTPNDGARCPSAPLVASG